ncbi:Toll/interleukin-1 receptor domain-containing protein [Tanacetum coccineum]
MNDLANMKELRFLHVKFASAGMERWYSKIVQLCKGGKEKALLKLRFLKLTYFSELRTLDLSVAPNLETLILEKSWKNYTCLLKTILRTIDFRKLKKLRTLHLGITPNLQTVSLKDCRDFVKLQIPAECPKLVTLVLSNCIQVAELPEGIGRLECLKELDITGTGIRNLPESIFRLKGLRIVGSRRILEHQIHKSSVPWSCDDFEQLKRPKEITALRTFLTGGAPVVLVVITSGLCYGYFGYDE